MRLDDFNYHLPDGLIATTPLRERSQSRLLVVAERLEDHHFKEIIDYIEPGDLLVSNNTRVVKARLFGNKASGGKVEVMLERVIDSLRFVAHVRTSKSIKPGMEIYLAAGLKVTVTECLNGLFLLTSAMPLNLYDYLEQHGSLPLPPYMQRQAELSDESRYQTVYAEKNGSVAAPTAGLHFTAELLQAIKAKGARTAHVTLHVGSGTFKPVSAELIKDHKMHSELFEIGQETIDLIKETKSQNGKIICVGTTSLRTLETVAARGLCPQQGETDIFITPGYKFQLVDKLITNFHLPKSTLLMLVAAFSGKGKIDQAYQHAIDNNYRFFSYGDAMLLTREDN